VVQIISSFDKFSKVCKGLAFEKNPERVSALKHYFSKGGVIQISPGKNGWPKLIYPSPARLKQQINEVSALKGDFEKKQSDWRKKYFEASVYHITHNVKKLKEPLYWQHLAKAAADPDYRNDAAIVKLPVHLVADKRWKPMIKMFVTDLEYRKQLTETVQNSIVYKKDPRVAKFADTLQNFRMDESTKKIEFFQKKIDSLDQDISALNELLKWSKS